MKTFLISFGILFVALIIGITFEFSIMFFDWLGTKYFSKKDPDSWV